VIVRAEGTPEGVRIEVQDNGRGLTDEQLKRVFDPFFTTRQEAGGTGLGLSIAHGIVAEHGGRIDVHSRCGQGTTFVVELPRQGSCEKELGHVEGVGG
jgi:two-component system NtrC family sensor kinase